MGCVPIEKDSKRSQTDCNFDIFLIINELLLSTYKFDQRRQVSIYVNQNEVYNKYENID